LDPPPCAAVDGDDGRLDWTEAVLDHDIAGLPPIRMQLPPNYEASEYPLVPPEGGAVYGDGQTWSWVRSSGGNAALSIGLSRVGGFATIGAPEGTRLTTRRECISTGRVPFNRCLFELEYPTGILRRFAVATWIVRSGHWLKALAHSSSTKDIAETCTVFSTLRFD
jgi:hypothetical protein